tara:strand:- start:378 stop:1769 length:1392 start_codon:yes stop_codon:yes gene_type:complete
LATRAFESAKSIPQNGIHYFLSSLFATMRATPGGGGGGVLLSSFSVSKKTKSSSSSSVLCRGRAASYFSRFWKTTTTTAKKKRRGRLCARDIEENIIVARNDDSDEKMEEKNTPLEIGDVTLGTMTFGNQNTEREAHEQLAFACKEFGVRAIDTAEMYPVPADATTQGKTDEYVGRWLKRQKREDFVVMTKVAGRSQMALRGRAEDEENRMTAKQMERSVECSLERLQTEYIDVLQLHWPDRYVSLFGGVPYERNNERDDDVPFEEQAEAMYRLIKSGKVRHFGTSNETAFGVCEFGALAKYKNGPKMQTIQNGYNLLQRIAFETDLNEACSPKNHDVSFLAYSPLAGGALTGKYLNKDDPPKNSRFTLFPGYMSRFNEPRLKDCLTEYQTLALESGTTLTDLSLRFVRDRDFVRSTIIGATTMPQLEENLNAFTKPPLTEDVNKEIERIYRKYRDPAQMRHC